ncbi:MAG TPA: hypothetical protein VG389_01255, partial [Myxococcota bacterium]|nr:hypothetical protein [Myxococcota bacterium]
MVSSAPDGATPLVINRPLPPNFVDFDAVKVVRRLTQFGYRAYLVGGGVRDFLLGATPKDFDVATDARPREVKDVFRNCRLIGRRFRLAHIHFRGGKIIEVSTFRRNPDMDGPPEPEPEPEAEPDMDEGEAPGIEHREDAVGGANGGGGGDGAGALAPALAERAPRDLLIREDNVFGTEEEDARRRDFTCNALFYDLRRNAILDYVGGVADVERRVIRTIGDPNIRLAEDPVRILRAVRFGARLGLQIEPRTFAAMKRVGPELAKCAAPRLLEELLRILRSPHAADAWRLLEQCGALAVCFPEIAAYRERTGLAADVDEHVRLLGALDELQERAGGPLHDSVLLSVTMWPLVRRALEPVPAAVPGASTAAPAPAAAAAQAGGAPERAAETWADVGSGGWDVDVPGASGAVSVVVSLPAGSPRRDPGAVVMDLLRGPAVRLRMPHRLVGRATQILLAQGKMTAGRRRRFRPEQLVRREFCGDAVNLLEMRALASGERPLVALSAVEAWRQLLRNPGDPRLARELGSAVVVGDGRTGGAPGPGGGAAAGAS